MADTEGNAPSDAHKKRALPGWAKALAAVAVLLMIAGLALPFVGGGGRAQPTGGAGAAGATGVTGLTTGGMGSVGDSGTAPPEPAGAAAWGPSIFRLGFSAFVGFAIGFALRSFLKLALVALGFFFIALFGLQYAGLVEVRWAAMSERYDTISENLQTQARGVWSSLSVLLPSAASATAGLFAGLWRRAG